MKQAINNIPLQVIRTALALYPKKFRTQFLKSKWNVCLQQVVASKLNYTLNQITRNPNLVLHMGLGWGRRNIEKKNQFSLTPSEFCHWKCVWLLSSGLWKLATTTFNTYIQCAVLPFDELLSTLTRDDCLRIWTIHYWNQSCYIYLHTHRCIVCSVCLTGYFFHLGK